MKKAIVTAALGLGVMVGSLMNGAPVGATPQSGVKAVASANYACDCESMVTTSALNLRSGPGTSYGVKLVMPEGAEVLAALSPELHENGFVKVKYGDSFGWASEDYLSADGSGSGGFDPAAYDESLITGTGWINDRVNFREGPGTDYGIQDVIHEGTQIAWTDVVVNGFRYIWYAGNEGWVYNDYVSYDDGYADTDTPEAGSYLTTTSNLNLRQKPSLSSKVLLVMPEGAEVQVLTSDVQNGFITVTYNGISGWASLDYLS